MRYAISVLGAVLAAAVAVFVSLVVAVGLRGRHDGRLRYDLRVPDI